MSLSTHVLDLSLGRPAQGVALSLARQADGGGWTVVQSARTDDDGRAGGLGPVTEPGTYRIHFEVGDYFGGTGRECFYPFVEVVFQVTDPEQHFHVPLLVSPYGYSTYRGS